MTHPDRDGAWRPFQPQQREDETYGQAAGAAAAPLPPPPQQFLGRPAEAPPPAVVARASVPVPAPAPAPAVESTTDTSTESTSRRLSAPAITDAALATASATALAELAEERPDDGGPPAPEPTSQMEADARTGPSGTMSRLHIGWHKLSRAALREVTIAPSANAGLILGRDRQHQPVPLPLFAPEPVRATLVGGVWAAQLLLFRAFALGARVAVVTHEPHAWSGFGERATGVYHRLTVVEHEQDLPLTGTAQTPALVVYDLGLTGPPTPPPLGPWRTQLTLLRQLDRPGIPSVQDARYTLVQRLGGEESALVASALRLRQHSGQFLQFMPDDMMALIEDGTERYVFLAQTGPEQQHVGMPRR